MDTEENNSKSKLGFLRSVSCKLDFSIIKNSNGDVPVKKSKSLPSTPVITNQLNLTFNDLSYSVRTGLFYKEKKNILSNISGDFRPGELTAILGPSGAGKSSLMDILAGFTTIGVTGDVQVNGRKRDLSAFRRSSSYIMQDDNLQPLLTVQEIMHVAADLKLDTPRFTKIHTIGTILTAMGLDANRATSVQNLSGGQKKRLAIALELITNPPIMFFDEPTSGLDSVTSRQCMSLLKSLANEGRTIICTIHQPSATLFDMIDHLYVVANGHCIYSGGTQNLVSFLQRIDLHCPTYHNPADFLLETLNGDYGDHFDRLIQSSKNGNNHLWRTLLNKNIQNGLEKKKLQCSAESDFKLMPGLLLSATPIYYSEARKSACYATSAWTQFCVLLRRNALRLSRDKVLMFMRLTMHLVTALLVGTIFFRIGQDAAYAIDNSNLLFFSLMFIMYSAFSASLITFPAELPILTREHFNRWYKLHLYYIANKLADLPIQITAASIYALIMYQMSDQIPEFERFGLSAAIYILVSLVSQTIGLIIGTCLNVQNGVIFGPCTILPFMMFSGFFVRMHDVHLYFQWLFHISFVKYGFEGVMVAIYGFDRPKMTCSQDYCHYVLPKKLLDVLDMKHASYSFSALVLLGLYIVLDLIAYLLLRLRLKSRQFR